MKSLESSVEEYVKIRKSVGYKLERAEYDLKKFIAFLAEQGVDHITTLLALQWAHLPKNVRSTYWAQRLTIVRLFARYRLGEDPRTEIPPAKLLAQRPCRATPHIYSNEEIRRIMQACKLQGSRGLRHNTYSTFFGLMAVTGCRISELIALDRNDFDEKLGLVKIYNSKCAKSRLLPLHSTTLHHLKEYGKIRDKFHPKRKTNAFFVQDRGARITKWSVRGAFIRASKEIGLRASTDSHGPRVHDMRHSFAVKTILRWYREGTNVNQKIAYLSAYLGHKKPSDTYYYLTGVPELLANASARLENQIGE